MLSPTRETTRIITATLDELGDAGPEGLTIERIAERAGLPADLVARLYPDLSTLLHDAVDRAVEATIGRAIDDLPEGRSPAARLGLFCHRLWAAVQLPTLVAIYRLANVENDRIGTFVRLLGELQSGRTRAVVRELVAEAAKSGELRGEDGERKADRIVTLLFAHGFWYHFPEHYQLFTAEPPESVVSQILLVTLGPEGHNRVMAAARGLSQRGHRE